MAENLLRCVLLQEGMQEEAREFARLMLGDGRPEQEVRRYTDLSSEEIRQIKSEIRNSRDRLRYSEAVDYATRGFPSQ